MREPTTKEKDILRRCLIGLEEDVQQLIQLKPSRDVHGTTQVNLEVMLHILNQLKTEE